MNDWSAPQAVQFVERIAGLAYSCPEAEDVWDRILAASGPCAFRLR